MSNRAIMTPPGEPTRYEALTQADLDQQQIDAAKDIEEAKTKYLALRKENYPDIGEQLDAILKQLNYLRMNNQMALVQDLDNIIGQWLQVKEDYPKPKDPV